MEFTKPEELMLIKLKRMEDEFDSIAENLEGIPIDDDWFISISEDLSGYLGDSIIKIYGLETWRKPEQKKFREVIDELSNSYEKDAVGLNFRILEDAFSKQIIILTSLKDILVSLEEFVQEVNTNGLDLDADEADTIANRLKNFLAEEVEEYVDISIGPEESLKVAFDLLYRLPNIPEKEYKSEKNVVRIKPKTFEARLQEMINRDRKDYKNRQALTEDQLKELTDIIKQNMVVETGFSMVQQQALDPFLLQRLGLPANSPSIVKNDGVLHKLAVLLNELSEDEAAKMTFEQLKERVKEVGHLSTTERNRIEYAKKHAGTEYGDTFTPAEQEIVRSCVVNAIRTSKTHGQLASDLGHAVGDWTRDWHRVAHIELWNALLYGDVATILRGQSIYSNTEGEETLVFRRPAPDESPICKKLLLEADGVTPKVFRLGDLIANGTNVGKRKAYWKPVVGTIHPTCSCTINVLPEGFGFDESGNLVYKDLDYTQSYWRTT